MRAGATVLGYDPLVPTEFVSRAEACRGAELVLSVNSAADALDALAQGMPGWAGPAATGCTISRPGGVNKQPADRGRVVL